MKPVPMLDLHREFAAIRPQVMAALETCFAHQQWILGPEVAELEKKLAQFLKIEHCIGVSSGTDALVLALRAFAITKKKKEFFDSEDKIITTPLTFTATGDAILRSGATPVFVDIDPVTFNLDPHQVSKCLNEIKGIVGIVPVHLYGQPCEMDPILAGAESHGVFVLEDVAQALGGYYREAPLSTVGHAGCLSFFPSKNLGGFGDGGMVTTRNAEIAEVVRMLLKHGGKDKNNALHVGYNARLDTLQAALLLAKLDLLSEWNKKRATIAETYRDKLAELSTISCPQPESGHAYNQFTIRVLNGRRAEFQTHLKARDIGTMIYYQIPLHKMPVFKNCSLNFGALTHAEQACNEVVSLPIEPLLEPEEIERVISAVCEFK